MPTELAVMSLSDREEGSRRGGEGGRMRWRRWTERGRRKGERSVDDGKKQRNGRSSVSQNDNPAEDRRISNGSFEASRDVALRSSDPQVARGYAVLQELKKRKLTLLQSQA